MHTPILGLVSHHRVQMFLVGMETASCMKQFRVPGNLLELSSLRDFFSPEGNYLHS